MRKLDEINESLVNDEIESSTFNLNNDNKIISSLSTSSTSSSLLAGGNSNNNNNSNRKSSSTTNALQKGAEQIGRRPLLRSSTENFISSLKNQSSPFGSILAPLSDDHETTEESKLQSYELIYAIKLTIMN